MNSLRLLLLLLLTLALGLTGCPSGNDDDSASDDDDATADDDDDDDDDDDATGDDDDATGAPISCDSTLPVISESEPNDKEAQLLAATGAGFCIEGTVTCGAEQYLDNDLFVFQLAEARTVTATLNWTGESDVDSYGYIGEVSENPLFGFEEGYSGPEVGTMDVVPGEDYLFQVACWDGQDTPYTLEVTYDEIAAGDDDDDSAGDDDDATGDDDDSATGDDDDSTGTAAYTFSDIYTNIVSTGCSCHNGGSSGGWTFAGSQANLYTAWVNAPAGQASMDRVEPGDSLNSYVMHKLDGTHANVGGSGQQMPLGGTALSQADRDGIRAWIDAGAPNN